MAINSSSSSEDKKSTSYRALLTRVVSESQSAGLESNLTAIVEAILNESLGIVDARPLLDYYVSILKDMLDSKIKIAVGKHALHLVEPRVTSFEEQDYEIRTMLANAYTEQEEFIEAAKVLQGIHLETSQRKFTDRQKVENWIRICRLYMEEDDTTNAESYLNRAKTLLYKIEDQEVNLTFQLCQGRIHDSNRKFLDACHSYHSVSLSPVVADDERNLALSRAIICAVLSPAGPQRSRALGKLYKDERASQLEEHAILEKMFLDRLISPQEVKSFSEKLAPHQLARTADGSTVLAKAVIEHNLFGASKLYSNLAVEELGGLLGLDAEKAEQHTATMLIQRRLEGSMDQIRGLIFFGNQGDPGEKGTRKYSSSGQSLRNWDRHVQGLLEDVERVSSLLYADAAV